MSLKPSQSLNERRQHFDLLDICVSDTPVSHLQQISDSQVFQTVVCLINKNNSTSDNIGFGFSLTRDRNIIQDIEKGGPAEAAGLQARDRVVKVNDIPVKGKSHEEIGCLIRGVGTINQSVKLEVNRYTGGKRRAAFCFSDTSAKEVTTASPTEIRPDDVFIVNASVSENSDIGGLQQPVEEIHRKSEPRVNGPMTSNITKRSKSNLTIDRPQSFHQTGNKEKKKSAKAVSNHKLDSSLDSPSTPLDKDSPAMNPPMNRSLENLVIKVPTEKDLGQSKKFVGRGFSDDDDDDDYEDARFHQQIETYCEFFKSALNVTQSPALTAILIKSRMMDEISSLLYYLCVQDYKRIMHSKEMRDKGRRLAIEIYTTFQLQKSPLFVNLPCCLIEQTKKDIYMFTPENIDQVFDKTLEEVLKIIQEECNDWCKKIRHGMWHNSIGDNIELRSNMSREEELALFDQIITDKVQKLQQFTADDKMSNLDRAYLTSLATVRRHFYEDCTWRGIRSGDLSIGHTNGGSITSLKHMSLRMGRSVENMSYGGNHLANFWKNVSTFSTKTKRSMFRRKDKQSFKGHSLQERHFEEATECEACNQLLWGIGPQGLHCSNCGIGVHTNCRLRLTDCHRDKKKSNLNRRTNSTFFPSTCEAHKDGEHFPDTTNTPQHLLIPETPSAIKSNDLYPAQPPPNSHDGLPPRFNSMPSKTNVSTPSFNTQYSLPINNPDTGISSNDVSSTDSADLSVNPLNPSLDNSMVSGNVIPVLPDQDCLAESDINNIRHSTLPNLRKADESAAITSARRGGYVDSLVKKFDSPSPTPPSRTISRLSTDSYQFDIYTAAELSKRIVDEWQTDTDMNVGPTFDAEYELKQFTEFQMPESQKDENYKRLLVLMEFHHKIRFLVQYVKSFEYFLVNRWPDTPDGKELKNILALDCIKPLVKLFKSLAIRLDSCRTAKTYTEKFGDEILDWMTCDNEKNMVSWLVNCSQLVACNTLKEVPTILRSYRRKDPTLTQVLSLKHNKFNKVESLSQTRTFLFSLPMIAGAVHKTLTEKTTSFRDEGLVWEQILKRCNALPRYMNAVTLPLVNLLNNNQIMNIMTEEFKDHKYKDFPKSLFRQPVLAQTIVHLDQQSVTVDKQGSVAGVDVKGDVTALALLFKQEIVILVRDNEKYVLKIKPKSRAVYPLTNFHLPKPGQEKTGPYNLKVVIMEGVQCLLQMQFDRKEDRDDWVSLLDHIKPPLFSKTPKTPPRPVEMHLCLELLLSKSEEQTIPTPLDTSLNDDNLVPGKNDQLSSTIEETEESNTTIEDIEDTEDTEDIKDIEDIEDIEDTEDIEDENILAVNGLKDSLREAKQQFNIYRGGIHINENNSEEEDESSIDDIDTLTSTELLNKFMGNSLESCEIVAEIMECSEMMKAAESKDESNVDTIDHKPLNISSDRFDWMTQMLYKQIRIFDRLRSQMIKCEETRNHCKVPNAPSIHSMPDDEDPQVESDVATPVNRLSSDMTSSRELLDAKMKEFAAKFIGDIIVRAQQLCIQQQLTRQEHCQKETDEDTPPASHHEKSDSLSMDPSESFTSTA